MKPLTYIIIFGDAVYILWILYNGIDDGFADIFTAKAVAAIGLVLLLILNAYILSKQA